MSVKSDYVEWKRKQPDIGCQFAKLIATRPDRYGQAVLVVNASTSANRIAASIAARITALVADASVAAGALLFPNITNIEQLAGGILALADQQHWHVSAKPLVHDQEGDLVAISACRDIPFGDSTLPSEALVLGPFDIFPRTRKAPVAALEIFVGPPRQLDPKTAQVPTKANLAHMDVYLPSHRAFTRMWDLSAAGRTRSLDGVDDPRAKAKVTLVVTKAMYDRLMGLT